MKICNRCNKELEDKKFVSRGNGKRAKYCHKCRAKTRNKEYIDRRKRIDNGKKAGYILKEGQRDNLLLIQNNLCAICKDISKKELVVDHNHINGEIRGLLCRTCNTGIGMMKDSPDILRAASLYLIRE